MRNRLKRSSVFIAALALLVTLFGVAPAVQAATGDILPPFNTGESWNICQGYNNPSVSHTGTSAYGLDLTGAGCNDSASGRTVRAPMNGTVVYYQAAYGNLCINVSGGRSLTLTHINSSITSGTVTAGQNVGTVAAPGTRGNNGVAHIHFQMWASSGCYNGSGIPFDSAHDARICGAPDLTASGPNGGNGTWSGTSFTGASCGTTRTSELLFYSDAALDANIRDVMATGSLGSTMYSDTWSNWDAIVPLEIDGTPGDELLFYSKTGPTSGKGKAAIYQMNGDGLSTKLYEDVTWRNDWSHLVRVDVDGDSKDELLFYSDTTLDANIRDVTTAGDLGGYVYSDTWGNWDTIVPLEIDGTSGNELLFYSKTGPTSGKGKAAAYQLNGDGLSTKLFENTTWRNNWTHIVPVDVDGDSRDELLFYSDTALDANIRDVSSTGSLGDYVYSGAWSNWDTVVPFEIDGTSGDELLFYSMTGPTSGKGKAAAYQLNGDGLSTKLFENTTWRNNWTHIVPVDIDGS